MNDANVERKILHVDMDAFYASVEQRDFPGLRGKPVIVGGKPNTRGVVAACSYEARKFGVHSAMSSRRAAQLCKDAIFVKSRFDVYREVSSQIHQVFRRYASEVEPLSLDEAYLDVTQAAKKLGSATRVAQEIKREIKRDTKLTASAGVSFNKFLAKIASDMDKPDGLFVIRPEEAQAFIESLDIRKFYGVGKVTEKKMRKHGIHTGADLKRLSREELDALFGRSGAYYYNIARAIDTRPVRSQRVRKSIGAETTFEQDIISKRVVWETLQTLTTRVTNSLSKKGMCGKTVTLKVKYHDFVLNTRSKTLDSFVMSDDEILHVLPELLKKTEIGHRPIRLVGVSISGLLAQENKHLVKDANDLPQMGLFGVQTVGEFD